MGDPTRFQEILRRLRLVDERFFAEQAGLDLCLPGDWVLDARCAMLVQLGALVVSAGSPPLGVAWSATRAKAAGATDDEIVDVLRAVAPLAGLGRVIAAVPDVASALGYDIESALEDISH